MMVKPFTIIMKLMTVGSRTRQNPTGFPWGFFVAAVGGMWGCKIAEDRKTILFFLLLPIFCTWFIFVGRKRRKQQPCLGKQNCRRSQTLCFYCYFRSSAICATFRFAEPRQSNSDPYIKNPSVSWDRGGVQGILCEDALHKVPPSNKYMTEREGA